MRRKRTFVNRHPHPQHFTASGIVLHEGHVLLVHHNRIGAWVPPGGHIESMELPHETVVREVLEETGLNIEILSPAMPRTGDADAFFLPRPLYIQCVAARERGGIFYHVDMSFLCRPLGFTEALPEPAGNREVKEARWVSLDALGGLPLARNVLEGVALAVESLASQASAQEWQPVAAPVTRYMNSDP